MSFKLNISDKGKSWRLEIDSEILVGKSLGDVIKGQEISAELSGYELKLTGASDIAGFPHKPDIEGQALKRVLLTYGWGMHKRPKKEGKKRAPSPKGLRLRKTVRGKELSEKTVQVNMIVEKIGDKPLNELFPEQNKVPEPEKKETTSNENTSSEEVKSEIEKVKSSEDSAEEKKEE